MRIIKERRIHRNVDIHLVLYIPTCLYDPNTLTYVYKQYKTSYRGKRLSNSRSSWLPFSILYNIESNAGKPENKNISEGSHLLFYIFEFSSFNSLLALDSSISTIAMKFTRYPTQRIPYFVSHDNRSIQYQLLDGLWQKRISVLFKSHVSNIYSGITQEGIAFKFPVSSPVRILYKPRRIQ